MGIYGPQCPLGVIVLVITTSLYDSRLLIPLDLLKFSAEEMACSYGEEQWLISSGGQRKYGTTSSHTTKRERLIRYDVQENDTLQGIALKFNVTVSAD